MGKHEERYSELHSFQDGEQIASIARGKNKNAFTRVRKMPVRDIITSIMTRKGLTAAMEIRNFLKASGLEAISKWAWLKARLNLNPGVFSFMNDRYMKSFYASVDEVRTWNGYIVLAIDGSRAEIPNSAENRKTYGTMGNDGESAPARCLISGLFDVLNDFFIDLQICTVKKSEIQAAEENVKALERIGIRQKALIIFDRGYPSLELLNYLEEHGIAYIIRISSVMYLKERRAAEGADCKVELEHTYRRMMRIKDNDEKRDEGEKRYEKIKAKGSTETRLVRDKTPSGEEFAVLTNLPDTIKGKEIVEAYFLRWKVEEAYNTLKNKMKFESATGMASIYVEQDFLSQILVYNMMEDALHDAEEEIKKSPKKYKYPRRINQNMAIGIFKDFLIDLQMEEDGKVRQEKMKILQSEIERYTLPVRKSKSKKRQFNPSNKYACNLKPSF